MNHEVEKPYYYNRISCVDGVVLLFWMQRISSSKIEVESRQQHIRLNRCKLKFV